MEKELNLKENRGRDELKKKSLHFIQGGVLHKNTFAIRMSKLLIEHHIHSIVTCLEKRILVRIKMSTRIFN